MTARSRNEAGFTIVELLVTMTLFSVISIGFYQVMMSGVRGNQTTQDLATIAQEARLGLNRMVRDTREASALSAASATSYTVSVVFTGSTSPANLTYSYDVGSKTIRLNGEVLIRGVEPIGTSPVFTYSSNRLEYDWNGDGITSFTELEQAGTYGVTLAVDKLVYVSSIDYAFRVRSGPRETDFYAQAQLRNRR